MSGAAYQGVFRNPLAEPYLIGVATGAALGATIVVVSGVDLSVGGLSALPLAAFAGALTSVVVVYGVARVGNTVPVTTLILAGVALSSLATAITSYMMLKDTSSTLSVFSVVLGSFNTATWTKVAWVLPYAVPSAAVILAHGRVLNVLSLDGVSTVLISCEGIDRGTLARGLQDKIRGVRVATVEGRFVVELPDEW